jgi:parallel beta-helix repeat protein
MIVRTKLILSIIALTGMLFYTSASAMDLQEAYNQAVSGEGYDKLLVLDPAEIYTGYLVVDPGLSCAIHGNGALIVLNTNASIWCGSQSKLDIDGCVIRGGAYGINYEYASNSRVENCTFVDNTVGIRCWGMTAVIKNCVVADNSQFGIACLEGLEPVILFNNVWNSGQLDYAAYCPG